MTLAIAVPLASRAVLANLYNFDPLAAVVYNTVDIAVSIVAFKYLMQRHEGENVIVILGSASVLGCLTGHLVTPGLDLPTLLLINFLSTSLFYTISQVLLERNVAIRN